MYRQILVPVDGSDASLRGLEHALALAKDQSARIRILNVVDELAMISAMAEPAGMVFDDILESMREYGEKVLERALARAKAAGVDAEAVQVASHGRPVSEVILADARRCRADIIVMGTHGRRGLNRLLLGSDAERVLRDSPVPVLLTRQGQRKPRVGARRPASKKAAKKAAKKASKTAAKTAAKSAAKKTSGTAAKRPRRAAKRART